MAKEINKTGFISELSRKLPYSEDKCIIINEILEGNFFISKKNKDKIIEEFKQRLNINHEEAIKVYDIVVSIINDEIKNKLKHPFKSKD